MLAEDDYHNLLRNTTYPFGGYLNSAKR
jgi:hypothetical protein